MKIIKPLKSGLIVLLAVIPLCVVAELRLHVSRTGGSVQIEWTNASATLEFAGSVSGPWSTVPGAASPFVISPTNASGFYRLWEEVGSPFAFRYVAPTFTTGIGDPSGGCGCTSPEGPNSLAAGGTPQDNGLGNVFPHTGEVTQHGVDLAIHGRGLDWKFERRYRSGMNYDGPLGHGWDFSHNTRLAVQGNGDVLRMDGLGRADRYAFSGSAYLSPSGFFTRLVRNPDGTFDEQDAHGTVISFSAINTAGVARLTRIRDRNGNEMNFGYNGLGQLTSAVDTLGRSIVYSYEGNGRLIQVTDFVGRTARFGYNAAGDLTAVTSSVVTNTPTANDFPAGKSTRYTYSSGFGEARFNHNLLTVTAPNEVAAGGPPRLVAQYDTNPASANADRVVALTLGGTNASGIGAGGTILYGYAALGSVVSNDFNTAVLRTTVTNRNGNVAEYRLNQLGNIVRQVQFTRGLRIGEPAGFTNRFEFNKDGLMTRQIYSEGNSLENTYDSGSPDRWQQGNLLQVRRLPGPRGADQTEIVTSHTYDTNFNFVRTSLDGRGNLETNRFDGSGNRTNTVHRLASIVEEFEYEAHGQLTAHVLSDNGSGHRRRDAFTYFASGPQTGYLQSQVVDSGGLNLTTTYERDSVGNVLREIDPRGSDTLYVVNALNQIVRKSSRAVSTPSGLVRYVTDTFYDANDNIIRVDVENRDDSGAIVAANPAFTTTHMRDILDQLLSTTQEVDPTNSITTAHGRDPNGNLVLTRFGEATAGRQTNNVVRSVFDERDLVFRSISAPGSPEQSTTQQDYNANGSLVKTSEGLEDAPHLTTYMLDGFERTTSMTDPMGNVRSSHSDAGGNTVSARLDGELEDVSGSSANVRLSEITYIYDPMDRQVQKDIAFFDPQTQTPIGDGFATTRRVFSPNSQVLAVRDDHSHWTTNSYDRANRLATKRDPKGNRVAYTYDASGNVIAITETDSTDLGGPDQVFITRSDFDAENRIVSRIDNVTNMFQYAYDSRGLRTLETDPRGLKTRHYFDGAGRLIRTSRDMNANNSFTDDEDIITKQTWDASGRLTSQTDDNDHTTRYAYDLLNRRIVTQIADGTLEQVGSGAVWLTGAPVPNLVSFANGHNVHGDPIITRDANGSVVSNRFDLNSRLSLRAVQPGPGVATNTTFEIFKHDGQCRTTYAENNTAVVVIGYDSLSHKVRETLNGATTTAVFDAEGNELSRAYPGGGTIFRSYDGLDQLQAVSDVEGPIANYNRVGKRVERVIFGNGTRADFTYNGLTSGTNNTGDFGVKQTARVRTTRINGGDVLDELECAWDRSRNKTRRADPVSGLVQQFTYDLASRLTQSSRTGGGDPDEQITYTLDGAQNRLAAAGGSEAGAYSMSTTLPNPADFQVNQYTTTPFDTRKHDLNGNVNRINDGQPNQKTLVFDYRNRLVRFVDLNTGRTTLFAYDAEGRRIAQIADATSGGPKVIKYFFAGWTVIEEQSALGAVLATYVPGPEVDELLSIRRAGATFFVHQDDQRSVLAITDTNAAVVERYRYADFGVTKILSGGGAVLGESAIGNPYSFNGRDYCGWTGFYNYRTRDLDSRAGRFIQRDTIRIWGDPFNLGNGYTYAANNPHSYRDPAGRSTYNPSTTYLDRETLQTLAAVVKASAVVKADDQEGTVNVSAMKVKGSRTLTIKNVASYQCLCDGSTADDEHCSWDIDTSTGTATCIGTCSRNNEAKSCKVKTTLLGGISDSIPQTTTPL